MRINMGYKLDHIEKSLLGFKGSTFLVPGYVHAPYIPLNLDTKIDFKPEELIPTLKRKNNFIHFTVLKKKLIGGVMQPSIIHEKADDWLEYMGSILPDWYISNQYADFLFDLKKSNDSFTAKQITIFYFLENKNC
jgi:hypothetical protein